MYNNNNKFEEKISDGFEETVVSVRRVSKKTKGGNQMRFSVLVVVGDKKGKVGVGINKAKDVRGAVTKAIKYAKARIIDVPLKGTTVPYDINYKYGAARILIKPAPEGTGITAGGPMRVVLEAAGVHDVVGKILGTNNKITNVYATFEALKRLGEIKLRKGK